MLGITCPECNGVYRDCPECEGTGKYALDRCPSSYQTTDVYTALRFWPSLRQGLGVVPGGMGEQAASLLIFVEFLEGEMARIDGEREEGRQNDGMTPSGKTGADLKMMFGGLTTPEEVPAGG